MRAIGYFITLGVLIGITTSSFAQGRMGPPQEAFKVCANVNENTPCSFQTPHGNLEGTCRTMPEGKVCVPAFAGGGPGQGMGQGMQGGGQSGMGQNMGNGGPSMMMDRPRNGQMGMRGGGAMRRSPPNVYTPNAPYEKAIQLNNKLADTMQETCFDSSWKQDCDDVKDSFPGQDAHYQSRKPAYRNNSDASVTDLNTGLTWQKAHNKKRLGFYDAKSTCDNLNLGGYDNWRLPTIKELFTITDFRGATGLRFFLDGDTFDLEEPDASILEGDRFASTHTTSMMGQTWSSTIYQGYHYDRPNMEAAFFFNFLDGRIKQAPTRGPMGLFYRCVRGQEWGQNIYHDNGNGTVNDDLTGLQWQQRDDGKARNWQEALQYCEGLDFAGHSDWRLPNVKELESIVDYSRPQPALDTTYLKIADPKGWFWSSTTHGDSSKSAAYVCFGKCISINGVDVHGAGAQRSDPKSGDPSRAGSQGGQQDQVRIYNYARCVRDSAS